MKAAIGIVSDKTDSRLSLRFARSNYFAIADNNTGKCHIIENPYNSMNMQAGKNSIEMLVKKERVDTLIACELGLNIQQYAARENIRLILLNDTNTTLNVLLAFMKIAGGKNRELL